MPSSLDSSVESLNHQLRERGVCKPDLLCLMATGTQQLIEHLAEAQETPLGELEGVPAAWRQGTLHSGRLGELQLWALDDLGSDPEQAARDEALASPPDWVAALPVWLAASAGAALLVHTSGGSSLGSEELPGFALVRDHINLTGKSPLTGLGLSKLGPLFPDQSRVHHLGLRHAALARADSLGLAAREAIVACTPGPALETQAERTMLARLGADVSVQGLAAPLIACSHSGLACLALVAVSPAPQGATDLERLVEHAAHAGPQLNQWLLALAPELKQAADALRAELLT